MLQKHRELKHAEKTSATTDKILHLKLEHKQLKSQVRKLKLQANALEGIIRDELLFSICSDNPSLLYKSVRNSKNRGSGKINKLKVGDRVYLGDDIPDGFYDSLLQLKTVDHKSLEESSSYLNASKDFENILEICAAGEKIPSISEVKACEILHKIKPSVMDLYSISADHYINAGKIGIKHFHILLSALIDDVSNITISEINSVHACILFKGHGKDKNSDRSYRTISVCPVVAKALDLYIRELNIDCWRANQADVQFQGEDSSHDLAALLLTECIKHSLFSSKEPMFALYLDAKSAFDCVL